MSDASIATAWLGRGLGFPVVPDERTRALPVVAGADKVRQALLTILDTEPGERVMRPDFGCGLQRFVMAANSVATRALIRHDVQSALTRWEPRVRIDGVEVLPGDDPALVVVLVAYAHLLDGRTDNLVYPFSLS